MAHGFKSGGRQKGTPNKVTKEVRDAIQELIQNEICELPNLLSKLEPQERLSVLIKLLPYVVPKMKPMEMGNSQVGVSVESFLGQFKNREEKGGFVHQFKKDGVD